MKVLVCENKSSAKSSPFMVTNCLGKLFTRITVAVSVSKKITLEEQSPLKRRQVVWRKNTEQMIEEQNSVKICNKSPKRETPPIY